MGAGRAGEEVTPPGSASCSSAVYAVNANKGNAGSASTKSEVLGTVGASCVYVRALRGAPEIDSQFQARRHLQLRTAAGEFFLSLPYA